MSGQLQKAGQRNNWFSEIFTILPFFGYFGAGTGEVSILMWMMPDICFWNDAQLLFNSSPLTHWPRCLLTLWVTYLLSPVCHCLWSLQSACCLWNVLCEHACSCADIVTALWFVYISVVQKAEHMIQKKTDAVGTRPYTASNLLKENTTIYSSSPPFSSIPSRISRSNS